MLRYSTAAGIAVVAFLLKSFVAAAIPLPYLFAYPAVFAAAVFGGLGPGLLATFLSALLATHFLIAPFGQLAVSNAADAAGLGVFLGMGTLMSIGAEKYRRKSTAILASREGEAALREARDLARRRAEELAAVLDAAPAAIFIARDPDAKSVEADSFGEKLPHLGRGANASKSAGPAGSGPTFKLLKNGVELLPHELPVQVAAATGQEVRDFEMDVVGEGWPVRHIFGSATPLRDASGHPYGAVGAFVDVTEARRAEERM
ncbi:MAG TPA: DUF4118 domain-containing protein, partial [Anaeromyxobacteraceae bacterium]|nr:DUF4118 domain-containing protein [Anaeromyxobacteraceae bacterium]